MSNPSFGGLTRDDLDALADKPLDKGDRCNRPWLPLGKRAAPRVVKPPMTEQDRKGRDEMLKRKDAARVKKIGELLDYYGATTVPFQRIAEHMKMPLNEVTDAMKRRGRVA